MRGQAARVTIPRQTPGRVGVAGGPAGRFASAGTATSLALMTELAGWVADAFGGARRPRGAVAIAARCALLTRRADGARGGAADRGRRSSATRTGSCTRAFRFWSNKIYSSIRAATTSAPDTHTVETTVSPEALAARSVSMRTSSRRSGSATISATRFRAHGRGRTDRQLQARFERAFRHNEHFPDRRRPRKRRAGPDHRGGARRDLNHSDRPS